jgi:hypothetical protein
VENGRREPEVDARAARPRPLVAPGRGLAGCGHDPVKRQYANWRTIFDNQCLRDIVPRQVLHRDVKGIVG